MSNKIVYYYKLDNYNNYFSAKRLIFLFFKLFKFKFNINIITFLITSFILIIIIIAIFISKDLRFFINAFTL